jgi:hypothetical protein
LVKTRQPFSPPSHDPCPESGRDPSHDNIAVAVIATDAHQSDVIERGVEAGKLLVAVGSLAGVAFEYLAPAFADVAVADPGLYIDDCDRLAAGSDFFRKQSFVECPILVGFTLLPVAQVQPFPPG